MFFKAPFIGTSGGVSSEHPLASVAGLKVLCYGGNAIDAAVAVSLSLAVTQPHLGALGGDFFALIYNAVNGKVDCLNASGWSPKKLNIEQLASEGLRMISADSPHSVVVPGMVDGLTEMHEKFGTIKFKRLFDFPIRLADKGFPVSYGLSKAISHSDTRLSEPIARNLYFRENEPLKPGEILVQKALAHSLRSLASDSRDFYEGSIAKSLCNYLQAKGGVAEIDDFKDFNAEWVQPLVTKYRGSDVYEVPPNSQGATTLMAMNILEGFNLKKLGAFSSERVHLFVEAAKMAYLEKSLYLADPRFVRVPLRLILSKRHAKKLADSISQKSVFLESSLKPLDTTNFMVVDKRGNIVSAIQSLFYSFGSGLIDPETGIFLNCRGSYFNLQGPNKLEPRKRPLHTLSSVIANSNENEVYAVGASGGDYRPQQHVLLLTNLLDYGMDLQTAVEAPRFLWNGGRKILVEEGFEGMARLKVLGHDVTLQKYPSGTGVAHCCMKKGNVTTLSADVRGDGLSIGPIG